jgi:predicted dehydrogenase
MPGLQQLKQWAGANGPMRYARAEMLRNRRLEPEFAIGTAIHPLDCLRFLCGEVREIETRCNPYGDSGARDFHVRLFFDSGVMTDVAVLVDCGVTREQYFIQVQNQLMEVSLGAAYSCAFCTSGQKIYKDNALIRDEPASSDPLVAGGFLGEHNLFLDAIMDHRLPTCNLQDARHSLRLAMAVHEQFSGLIDQFVPRTS